MKKILITTTETLHGWEIQEYLKPVFASVVIGTNIFSDISASFTDFFGGRSESYEKKLQIVKDNAINILTSKANELGANCLLGLKVDMDEISGKGTQMFMITAYATAVIANNLMPKREFVPKTEVDKGTISEKAVLVKLLEDLANPKYVLQTASITLAKDNKASEFKDVFFDKLREHLKGFYSDIEAAKRITKVFADYFYSIDPTLSKEVLYNGLLEEKDSKVAERLSEVILQIDLIDLDHVKRFLDSEDFSKRKVVLILLMGDKPFYVIDDWLKMNLIIDKINGCFPERGVRSIKKGGFISGDKEIWTCECGKANDFEHTYCDNCLKDIYGFSSEDAKPKDVVEKLSYKSEALKQFFHPQYG